jgi:hypothetical protein
LRTTLAYSNDTRRKRRPLWSRAAQAAHHGLLHREAERGAPMPATRLPGKVPGGRFSPEQLLQMQRTYGNRAVQRLLGETGRQDPGGRPHIQRCGGAVHAGCSCAEEEPGQQPAQLQRLTPQEKEENLESTQYAGDARLEAAFDNSPPMRKGESGDAVRKVQEGLVDDGFLMPFSTTPEGEMDGVFGDETVKTVWRFQGKHGLDQDAAVGRQTMRVLDELARASPPGELPECKLEPEETEEAESALSALDEGGETVVSDLDGPETEAKNGGQCKPKKKIGIKPRPGKKETDFFDYECESEQALNSHIYSTADPPESALKNLTTAFSLLSRHKINLNMTFSALHDPTDPDAGFGTVNTMLDLCRLIRHSLKKQSPTPGFLPAFFVPMGPDLKSAAGLETIQGVHMGDLDSQCAELKEKTGLGQCVLIDTTSGCDIIFIHELGHAVGAGHDTGPGSEKNVMAPAGCSSKDQNRINHHMVRKLCNAKF